ncbi:MAG: HAD family hydrolase [Gemmatimonadota bacterium]|nr:HAD family hydrolase [Gemmatimonadota bacterium]
MPLRAVLFDFDGTLVDTLDDIATAMNHALVANDLDPHPTDAYRGLVGEGVGRLVERAIPADRQELHEPVLDELRVYYTDHMIEESRPYPGVPELLDELTSRGIPMAVLSNKPHEATAWMVEQLLGDWEFARVYGESTETPKKPDPAGALRIAGEVGIEPADWLYLGDTKTDMQTASAAGMMPVGALWGFRDREELVDHGARAVVERPGEVVELLEE